MKLIEEEIHHGKNSKDRFVFLNVCDAVWVQWTKVSG